MIVNTKKLKKVSLEDLLKSKAKKEYFALSTHTTYYGEYESNMCFSDIPEELDKLEKEGKIIQISSGLGHHHFSTYINNNGSYFPVDTKERPAKVTADGFSLVIATKTNYAVLDESCINSLTAGYEQFAKNVSSEDSINYLGRILTKTKTERNKDLVKLRKIARRTGGNAKLNDLRLILTVNPNL